MADLVKLSLERAWPAAVNLTARWLERGERIDALVETLPGNLTGPERGRCLHLVLGVVRHAGRIEAALDRLIAHPPRFVTRAVLYVAGFELVEAGQGGPDGGLAARIVHHAVERTKTLASPAEARMVNAVVRKLAAAFAAQSPPGRLASAGELAEYHSHPEWLVSRWLATFGAAGTRSLLEWNQAPASIHARWRDLARPPPDWLSPAGRPGFFTVPPGRWQDIEPLLAAGSLYLQDPGTADSVALLDPRPGETVLDLCAAPGGKSLLIADTMRAGRLVAVDLPSSRIDRLKENLARVAGVETALVPHDVREYLPSRLQSLKLPVEYPAVLIDVPCSNTGVMRHRVDVKWRLQEGDFAKHERQQRTLLSAAARLVALGGRLVYSTCSIDPAENERVVEAFMRRNAGFELVEQRRALPWEAGHDGGAAFLIRRRR